jgi:hypothetical protein
MVLNLNLPVILDNLAFHPEPEPYSTLSYSGKGMNREFWGAPL